MVWHVLFQSLICSCMFIVLSSSQSFTAKTLWNGFSSSTTMYLFGVSAPSGHFISTAKTAMNGQLVFGGAALIGLPLDASWDFRHLQARHSMAMYGLLRPCISSTIYCALFSEPLCADSWFILNISESYQGTITCPIMSHHIKTRSNHAMSYPFMSFHNPRTLQPPTSLSQPMMNWWYMNLMCSCPPCHYTVVTPLAFCPHPFYKGI